MKQTENTLSLKSKLIREYHGFEFSLWGEDESLDELKQLLGLLYDDQQLVRVSDVMTSLGLEPDASAQDCWWGLDYINEEEDGDEEDSGRALVVTEFTKGEFNEQRLMQVLRKLKKAKGLKSLGWEQVWYLDL